MIVEKLSVRLKTSQEVQKLEYLMNLTSCNCQSISGGQHYGASQNGKMAPYVWVFEHSENLAISFFLHGEKMSLYNRPSDYRGRKWKVGQVTKIDYTATEW